MDDFTVDDLSRAETDLIVDFIEWVGEFDRQLLDRQTIEGDSEGVGIQQAFEFLAPLISEDASEFDAQMLRLFRLEQEILSGSTFEYENTDELPSDARVTPEELNQFLKKDELEEFFTLAGQMIETLSVELVMEEVVADSRQSESIRNQVERKSQREREWLLHATGVLSDGNKGEIRRIYDLRSSIVHTSGKSDDLLTVVSLPSDLNRAKNAINALHENLHGIRLKHRFSELII